MHGENMETIFIENRRINPLVCIRLIKADACDSKIHLPGAVFDVFKFDEKTGEYQLIRKNLSTDSGGCLLIKDVPAGKYKFAERKAPCGYVIGRVSEWTVEVYTGGEEAELTVLNYKASACRCCCPVSCRCYKSIKRRVCGRMENTGFVLETRYCRGKRE
jgi:Predicted outer membrane protein